MPLKKRSKFERCVRKIKRRLPKVCKRLGYPGTKKCPNPWAVCRARLKRS